MSDASYRKLAKVLDTLPNGFPETGTGLELRLLQKIFAPDEAELFCDLRLAFETADQVATRTGRPVEGLDEKLTAMRQKGQIQGIELGGSRLYRMIPWVIGIYEMQIGRMDRELARLCNEYYAHFARQFLSRGPQLMRTIPIEEEVRPEQQVLPIDRVSTILEGGQSFAVNDCVCKTEERLLDNGCDHPIEVCLTIAPIPGAFDAGGWGRPISKDEARAILQEAEEAGLIHLTSNVQNGHYFICNCCGCCCAVLKGITKLGLTDVVNSDFYSDIDPAGCNDCGMCAANVCQLDAISGPTNGEEGHRVDRTRCIGCGQCVRTCPVEAIHLLHKQAAERVEPPRDQDAWYEERGRERGVDFSDYR